MAEATRSRAAAGERELQDLVAAADTGARNPTGLVGWLIGGTALAWSLFQLYIASPLPFLLARSTGLPLVLNDTQARSIHLAFALLLAFMVYPAWRSSPRDRIPVADWAMAIVAAFASLYIFLFYRELSTRPGAPITLDLIVAGVGLVLLLEATRRALGPPLMIVSLVFLIYVFFGSAPWIPEVIQWRGASFARAMDQMWLSTGGVFGVALGVSTSFVFLFVLFGSLLDRAGAGNYFIQLAFALLGHLRGGPAKAAVLASMMTGLISGSSIANVVTTGTFTIPLMKRVGFTPEKAGSVEVASSVNGQIMPPVMGAAAFLMVEYVGISYLQVIRHAFLPAVISYIALLYLVHLEAVKHDMPALPKPVSRTLQHTILRTGLIVSSIIILCGAVYWILRALQAVVPAASDELSLLLLLLSYAGLVWYAARSPDLELDDPDAPVVRLPIAGEVVRTGLHFLLPIGVLVWFLMVEQNSPGLSAFYAIALLLVILVTQRPLKAIFRREQPHVIRRETHVGFVDLIGGLVLGARNMIGIACATATAGIIVGTVTMTGLGQVMAEFVEYISGGNIMLVLVFTAVISLVLGMGLPTTANYIVVASLMAPVIVELGASNGVLIPLIAAHLFVFYFGIMADVTPPVGLASFAAAAVSGGDPLRTGFTAFFYSLRTVLLPFIFVFNTDLLLIGVGLAGAVWIFAKATAAMLIFAAATQNFFLTRSKLWESAALLLVTLLLLRPGFFLDQVQRPFTAIEPTRLYEAIGAQEPGAVIRLVVTGPDFENPDILRSRTLAFDLGPRGEPGEIRFERAIGLDVRIENGRVVLDEPMDPRSLAGRALSGLDFYGDPPVVISAVEIEADRPPKEIFYLPGLLLLGLVVLVQRRRMVARSDRALATG